MIDLKNTTFIIPVSVESEDRFKNIHICLSYLCQHLETNIIILEKGTNPVVKQILKTIDAGKTKIKYLFRENILAGATIFHRTKYLNEMLAECTTRVVVNYDCDILLTPRTYKKCEDLILCGIDLLYPYFWGASQCQVKYSGRDKISQTLSLDSLQEQDYTMEKSEYGHCQFFNAQSYREGGMENEGFISYGPEDQERGYRFQKLGYNVQWSDSFVYHMEHTRGINSSGSNPMMDHNNKLFEEIKRLSAEELKEYYKNRGYLKQYA